MDINLLLIALAAMAGGLVAAVLGFLDAREPFDARKFAKSVLFALVSGVGFALTYSVTDKPTTRDLFVVFLGGAGVDVVSNRIIGAMNIRAKAG